MKKSLKKKPMPSSTPRQTRRTLALNSAANRMGFDTWQKFSTQFARMMLPNRPNWHPTNQELSHQLETFLTKCLKQAGVFSEGYAVDIEEILSTHPRKTPKRGTTKPRLPSSGVRKIKEVKK